MKDPMDYIPLPPAQEEFYGELVDEFLEDLEFMADQGQDLELFFKLNIESDK